jgi:anti-sigma B factor antagonist
VVGNVRTVIEGSFVRNPVRGTACTTTSRVVLHTASEHLMIEVVGELDRRTARELLAVLLPAVRGGSRTVHLDLARVFYVGRSGVDALCAASTEAEARGTDLVLLRPSPAVRETLEAAGLTPPA